MMVFNFGPLSKNELIIGYDVDGANEFLLKISNISKDASRSMVVDCFEYSGREFVGAQIELKREDEERLEINGARLTLAMSDEACEYAEFLLKKFIDEGAENTIRRCFL
jgi:hypothetical protein